MVDDEVWSYFDGMPTAFVATVQDGKPQVRPLTVMHIAGHLYVLTGTGSNKVKQIRSDPRFELCITWKDGESFGYVRAEGNAVIIEDPSEKEAAAKAAPYFDTYWKGADDPAYTLLRLKMETIHLMRPNEMEEVTIEV